MAKKSQLAADMVKRLKAVGIKATTEEVAREELLKALKNIGVEGMEGENINSLLDMVEGFADNDEEEEDDEPETETEETDEEEKNDALAEEVESEDEEEETEEEDELPEEEEEEDEKPAKPAKSTSQKKAEKPAPAKKATEKKETKKAEKPATAKKSASIQPKANEDDQALFDVLEDIFPKDKFVYDFIKSGVTIKYKGANSKRGLVSFDNCTRLGDNQVKCNLFFLTMAKKTQVLDDNDIEYGICWSGAPFCKGVTLEEGKEAIEKVLDEIVGQVTKIDEKLGKNRQKMMDDLKKNKKTDKAQKTEVEEEETEATEAVQPKKETKKAAAPAKKVTKKKK